jgi:hypothetical protein
MHKTPINSNLFFSLYKDFFFSFLLHPTFYESFRLAQEKGKYFLKNNIYPIFIIILNQASSIIFVYFIHAIIQFIRQTFWLTKLDLVLLLSSFCWMIYYVVLLLTTELHWLLIDNDEHLVNLTCACT